MHIPEHIEDYPVGYMKYIIKINLFLFLFQELYL